MADLSPNTAREVPNVPYGLPNIVQQGIFGRVNAVVPSELFPKTPETTPQTPDTPQPNEITSTVRDAAAGVLDQENQPTIEQRRLTLTPFDVETDTHKFDLRENNDYNFPRTIIVESKPGHTGNEVYTADIGSDGKYYLRIPPNQALDSPNTHQEITDPNTIQILDSYLLGI